MRVLPSGWAMEAVGELGSLKLGKMLDQAKNQGLPASYLRNLNVRWFRFDLEDLKTILVSEEELEDLAVRDDDLFICEGGEPGRSAVWRGVSSNLVYQKALHRFRTHGALLPELLMYFLRDSVEVGRLAGALTGTTIKHLTKEKLERLLAPVPPFAEQRRIADKLDSLLARVDACRERLDRVPAILKRFRQAVLAAATSGELTRGWREARGLPSEWPYTSLEVLCQSNRVITYGVIKLGAETKGGVPCLRTSNVRWLRIDQEGLKRISPALSAEFGRTVLQGGEVLVNVRGTLGGVVVAEEEMRGWNVSREVAVVPCDVRRVESRFLVLWIGADRSQRWLRKVERGVAYTGINIEDLRRLPVALPPKPEQMEMVRRVEILQAVVDRIEVTLHKAVGRVEGLTGTVLAKAFRGELVPQDPNDEPAALLLERIRATGNNQKISGRTKGTRRKPAQPRE